MKYVDCINHLTKKLHFWPEIIKMQQDSTLVKMLPMMTRRLKLFIKKYHRYLWYQVGVYLKDHSVAGSFYFG